LRQHAVLTIIRDTGLIPLFITLSVCSPLVWIRGIGLAEKKRLNQQFYCRGNGKPVDSYKAAINKGCSRADV